MHSSARIGAALRMLRQAKGVSQEDFGVVSSRTYVSAVERGLKSPTLGKIEQLAEVLGVHPLTLLAAAYLNEYSPKGVETTLSELRSELLTVLEKGQ
ncbi:helix-turn-helix domain-containing protein [Burkholderia pseudomallei]|uniref:helix-turn-helix domain-containing protein n=3 Tax=Burkholderia pseudomallei TaxID=28450 RepID=UPI0004630E7B|nr:helix-turn-helix transcriptional regulator [Burkholderia pseudomallei]AIP51685.1 helix-turn-helix family protein [Burkholderia pseudomallei HBPUB10134a]MBF3754676.1 helix-turn-helix transcriptional regulator [Burkholderia pseudomallei]MBO7797159.1 helix-turn-helix transcriptional regulator [Burkholderia pseudomallei]MBO7815352.1 helix-turn-helix transcriptional regulator [Burkholderia pseudomallei]CAJ4526781.1 helix-turn-helix domain-containing protein [Burkholderia pseudomallei]